MAQAGSLWVKLGVRDKEFNAKLTRAQARTKAFSSQIMKLGAAIGIGFGVLAVVNLTKKIVTLQAEFSGMMSRVNALTQATTEMSAALRIQAQVLGRETQFTATQAAEAMTFLAQAGLNVNQIYKAMPNTLELAAVGQISLAEAADISTNIMAAYGLQAEDLGRVNDIIANTSTKANTNVREFAEAFKMVGPVAKSAKQGIVEISAMIGILANAGIKGTMAGTSLRTMISKLINPTGDAADILEKFNIQTQNLTGDGIRPLNDILAEMREKGVGLKEMFEIFDLRAAGSATVLKALSGEFEDFAETVGVSGTAARIAAEQMDNLRGDLLRVTSAWEGALLSLGQSNEGFMRAVSQSIAGLLNWITPQEKLSETLMETSIQMNAEIDALKSGNITGEVRVGLIDEINRKYRDYLPNLITEKTSIEELNILQGTANKLLFDKIKLRAQEEILVEELEKVFQLEKKVKLESIELEKIGNAGLLAKVGFFDELRTVLGDTNSLYERQAEKVASLVKESKEAKTAFEELKSAMTFGEKIPGAVVPTTVTPTPIGGGTEGIADAGFAAAKAYAERFNDFFSDFDPNKALSDVFSSSAIDSDDPFGILPFIEGMEVAEEKADEFQLALDQTGIKFNALGTIANTFGRVVGSIFTKGGEDAESMGERLVKLSKSIVSSLIREGIAAMIANTMKGPTGLLGPLALPIAAAAGAGAAALFSALIPSFKAGTDFVPFTGMAQLHKGEAVIPAAENRRSQKGGTLTATVSGEDLHFILEEFNRKTDNSF